MPWRELHICFRSQCHHPWDYCNSVLFGRGPFIGTMRQLLMVIVLMILSKISVRQFLSNLQVQCMLYVQDSPNPALLGAEILAITALPWISFWTLQHPKLRKQPLKAFWQFEGSPALNNISMKSQRISKMTTWRKCTNECSHKLMRIAHKELDHHLPCEWQWQATMNLSAPNDGYS
jgi:hypothetical protein